MITVNPDKLKAHRNEQIKAARAAAFAAELDLLTYKAVRGEATIADVQAKAAEIRARFPYEEVPA